MWDIDPCGVDPTAEIAESMRFFTPGYTNEGRPCGNCIRLNRRCFYHNRDGMRQSCGDAIARIMKRFTAYKQLPLELRESHTEPAVPQNSPRGALAGILLRAKEEGVFVELEKRRGSDV